LDSRLGGAQRSCGRCGEEKNLDLAGNRTSAVQPVAITSELSLGMRSIINLLKREFHVNNNLKTECLPLTKYISSPLQIPIG
jgi:hypothetical protein